jgi:peptide/nickel transport system substrate-binding protein
MREIDLKLQTATKLAGKGKISRRDFMQLALAAGIALPTASAMFVKAVRAEPKKGGSARIGLAHGATTDTLDPGLWPDTFTQSSFWGAMCNSLTEIDEKGNVVADAAESYEPSDGTKTWAFKIRKGLTFHNGKDVTPTDVVESFRHHMGKDTRSAAKSLLAAVADIKADG